MLNVVGVDEASYRQYLEGLLRGDRQQCREVFAAWLGASTDLRSLYEDVVRRSLYDVGELWEHGRISVATEHLATAITENLLNLTYPRLFAGPRVGRSAVITSVAHESHQLGGRMVADLFELHGWRGYFLGANTPPADLCAFITERRPDVVALSVTLPGNLRALDRTVTELRAGFPALQILVGGQAFQTGQSEVVASVPLVHRMDSLAQLEVWLAKYRRDE